MHCSFFFDLLFIRVSNRIALGLLSTLRGLGFVYIILATCPDCWSKPQAGNKLGSAWGRWSVSEPAARGSACICLSVSNKGRLDLLSTNALFPPLSKDYCWRSRMPCSCYCPVNFPFFLYYSSMLPASYK